MINNEKIKIVDENGEEKTYDIILSFEIAETGKTYILYTENKTNENDELELLVAKYNPDDEHPVFEAIDEEEKKLVDIVVDQIQEDLKYA